MPDAVRPAVVRDFLRTLPGRTSLRVKLISAVLVMVAIALAVISFAGISFLSRYLLGQADSQLAGLNDYALQRTLQNYLQGSPLYSRGEAVVWVPDGGAQQQIAIPVSQSGVGPPGPQQVIPGPKLPGRHRRAGLSCAERHHRGRNLREAGAGGSSQSPRR